MNDKIKKGDAVECNSMYGKEYGFVTRIDNIKSKHKYIVLLMVSDKPYLNHKHRFCKSQLKKIPKEKLGVHLL